MKIGIGSAPSIGSAGAYPGCLIDIQQGAAEIEHGREHDVGETVGNTLAAFPLRAQQRDQGQLRNADDDHGRGK
jgi:hypothetical protein